MIPKSPLLALFVSLVVPSFCLAQNIDSLYATVEERSSADQVRYFDDLAWDHMYTNFAYAHNYALKANALAIEYGLKKSQGNTYNTLGVICRRQGRYEESKGYLRQAKAIWDELDIDTQKVTFHMNMANVVRTQGYVDSALFFGEKGLEIAIRLGDSIRMSSMIVGLGTTYKNMGWYGTAIEYYSQGALIDQALEDTVGLGIYWSNIGDVMLEQGDFAEALKYYEITRGVDKYANNKLNEAITLQSMGRAQQGIGRTDLAAVSFKEAFKLCQEIGDDVLLADILKSQGNLELELGRIPEALSLYDQALDINLSYHDPLIGAAAHLGKGRALKANDELEASIQHLDSANRIASRINYDNVLLASHRSLAEVYSMADEPELAFEHLNAFVNINDRLHNLSIASRVAELENKYELSNKEHQIKQQASLIEQAALTQQLDRTLAGAVILALLILVGGLFAYNKRKQYKTKIGHEQERSQLKTQQIKAVIQSQEDERKRFAMDLHDDFGQLISALRIQANMVGLSTAVKNKINTQLDQMYASLKSIAFNLMPQTLVDKGLSSAVEELCLQLNQLGGLKFKLHTFDITDRLDDQEKVAAYRVIQEVVNNIIKYADASSVTINMTGLEDKLSIMIEDNGDGFDISRLKSGIGNGWRNIQSRLDLLEGEIDLDSVEGRKNSTVSIGIPYYKSRQQAA
ncbi:MAG: tetratricopeptide repeat protein [Cyclobacteriaceae bacterium]